MREYVILQTGTLLRHLASQVERAACTGNADAIHDLRVSIRRLSRCLRVFAQFYPGRAGKHIRRRLSRLMDACGNVRDRDIAIGLLQQAGLPAATPLVRQLEEERLAAGLELRRELHRWQARGFSNQWHERLEV